METTNTFLLKVNYSQTAKEKAFLEGKRIPNSVELTVNIDDLSEDERKVLLEVTKVIYLNDFYNREFNRFKRLSTCCYEYYNEEFLVDDHSLDIHGIIKSYQTKKEYFANEAINVVRTANEDFVHGDRESFFMYDNSDSLKKYFLEPNETEAEFEKLKAFVKDKEEKFLVPADAVIIRLEELMQNILKEIEEKENREAKIKAEQEEREKASKLIKEKCNKWIQEYGSKELKFAFENKMDCADRIFNNEYVSANYPEFSIEEDLETKSLKDLTIEDIQVLMEYGEKYPDDKVEIVSDYNDDKYLELNSQMLNVYIYMSI